MCLKMQLRRWCRMMCWDDVPKMCSDVFQMCEDVLGCVEMCWDVSWDVLRCVKIVLRCVETCVQILMLRCVKMCWDPEIKWTLRGAQRWLGWDPCLRWLSSRWLWRWRLPSHVLRCVKMFVVRCAWDVLRCLLSMFLRCNYGDVLQTSCLGLIVLRQTVLRILWQGCVLHDYSNWRCVLQAAVADVLR